MQSIDRGAANDDSRRERDRIVQTLDKALDEAQSFAKGDHEEFRELVKHCREMHDVLLAAMRSHPAIATGALESFVTTTLASIRELELLAGLSTTSRH